MVFTGTVCYRGFFVVICRINKTKHDVSFECHVFSSYLLNILQNENLHELEFRGIKRLEGINHHGQGLLDSQSVLSIFLTHCYKERLQQSDILRDEMR